MRAAVIGAGGFGGYFGARLAQGGADVRFLARSSHLAAMRANGLVVEGGPERICANPVTASDNPADLGARAIADVPSLYEAGAPATLVTGTMESSGAT
jgi:ketopantoate reductase